jgi:hypothetical protein
MTDRPGGGKLMAGDEIHYVALLDEHGNALATIPTRSPLQVPTDAEPAVDVHVTVRLTETFG